MTTRFNPLKSSVPKKLRKEPKKGSKFFSRRFEQDRTFATNTEIFNFQQAAAKASQSGAKGMFSPAKPFQNRYFKPNK